jgi:DNA invertase Pin-like site-specific DNA recombinase
MEKSLESAFTHAFPHTISRPFRCSWRRCAPTPVNAVGVWSGRSKDVGSGSIQRPKREVLLKAARRREVDAVLVWRLDRWGRSVADLVLTLKELNELGVGFVSLTEALDLTTPTGRAMAGLLAVFAEFEREILRERVRAGIAQARKARKPHGRPRSAAKKTAEVKDLFGEGISKPRSQTTEDWPNIRTPHLDGVRVKESR